MEPNQNPQGQPIQAEAGEKKSLGPVIGIIIVIILLVLGAFYVWGGKLSGEVPAAQDEVSSIESDLEGVGEIEIDLSDLDTI